MSIISTVRGALARILLAIVAIGAVVAAVVWLASPFSAEPATAGAEPESLSSAADSAPRADSSASQTPTRPENMPRVAGVGELPPSVAADGEVSWDEYEEAIWDSVECMERAGLEIRTYPHMDVSGKSLSYTVFASQDPKKDGRIRDIAFDCESKHAHAVKIAWAMQNRPTEEQLRDARAALAECLIEGGTPEEHVNLDRLIDAEPYSAGAFPRCAEQVSAEFGIPSFGG